MDLSSIEQKQRAERYLFGRLTAPEAYEFERQIRKSPTLAESLGISAVLERARRLTNDHTDTAHSRSTRSTRLWLPPALASALVLSLIGTLTLFMVQHRLSLENAQLASEVQVGRLIAPSRTATELVSPGLPGEHVPLYDLGSRNRPTLTELHIALKKSKATLYRVTIKRSDGTYWARLDNQIKDSEGALRLALNSGAFAVGTYSVSIESVDLYGRLSPAGELALRIA
jgi:hypothetical protein